MWLVGVLVLSEPSSTYKICASNEGFGETSLLVYAISIKILHVLLKMCYFSYSQYFCRHYVCFLKCNKSFDMIRMLFYFSSCFLYDAL